MINKYKKNGAVNLQLYTDDCKTIVNQHKMQLSGFAAVQALAVMFVLGFVLSASVYLPAPPVLPTVSAIEKFDSCSELTDAFEEARQNAQRVGVGIGIARDFVGAPAPLAAITGAEKAAEAPDYSQTNVQVEGVDEADIVKTDGNYIYTVSSGKMVITRAYPVEQAQVLSKTDIKNFQPQEIFIDNNMLLVFGQTYQEIYPPEPVPLEPTIVARPSIYPYPYTSSYTTVKLFDISDKSAPREVRSVDFEGNYLSSRKIGTDVYFVVNSYPRYYILDRPVVAEEIIPAFRDMSRQEIASGAKEEFEKIAPCSDIGYFAPINPERFVTVVSISMSNPDKDITKEVIVGSGDSVYSSQENLYIAERNYPYWRYFEIKEGERVEEKTIVHKFSLDNGAVDYIGNFEAPGRILNQFSMDEYNDHFRIATTRGEIWGGTSTNNVYIFDNNLKRVGSLEDLAPGEQIFSTRFIRDRLYMVTFKKIDPLFVIDLSDPANPKILGKLKIPGFSDYLHPYDQNNIIGLGKEAVDAKEGDFAWYQGVKLALFDVTDVENPKELHKIVIGDRGTDSYALRDHKAFLFDKSKDLLVIPILLAEIPESQKEQGISAYGDYKFQGAYVYSLTLDKGFEFRGRITHFDSDEPFEKSGYYFYDQGYQIQRSLYIDNVLYTISQLKIKANSLTDLSELKELILGTPENPYPYPTVVEKTF